MEGVADVLGQNGLFATTEAFVYAQDETCGSSYGAGWKSLLAGSSDPNPGSVRVGWTCSAKPASQAVDIPIVFAGQFDPAAAAAATGKEVWIYNGQRPQTDAFFTDTSAIAPRANMWIAVMAGIPRWFYWETTFWYDDNSGGHGSYDPFVTAETFHNGSGDYREGDGVLDDIPGQAGRHQLPKHSVGVDGVLPSVRLKNLRRGVEDAGYYALAHAATASRAEAIAAALLPSVLSAARDGKPVSWTETGQAWFAAREALLAIIPQQAPSAAGGADAGPGSAAGRKRREEGQRRRRRGDTSTRRPEAPRPASHRAVRCPSRAARRKKAAWAARSTHRSAPPRTPSQSLRSCSRSRPQLAGVAHPPPRALHAQP